MEKNTINSDTEVKLSFPDEFVRDYLIKKGFKIEYHTVFYPNFRGIDEWPTMEVALNGKENMDHLSYFNNYQFVFQMHITAELQDMYKINLQLKVS